MYKDQIDRLEKWIAKADAENSEMYSALGIKYDHDRAVETFWMMFGLAVLVVGFGIDIASGQGFAFFLMIAILSCSFILGMVFVLPMYRIYQYRKLKRAKT